MIFSPIEFFVRAISDEQCIICSYLGSRLCDACFESNIRQDIHRCYKCNTVTKSSGICATHRASSGLRSLWRLGEYEAELKELIWEMKFGRNRSNAYTFGRHLAGLIPYLPPNTIVAPVPTDPKRIRRRSFDQAVLLARTLAARRDLPYKQLLIRTGSVEQIGKSKSQRAKQASESLACRPGIQVTGLSVLLVDDVVTSGATLSAAARLLRSAGAVHVDAAVVARHLIS